MFERFKRRAAARSVPQPSPARTIRDTLFGDGPLDQWPPMSVPVSTAEPWRSFVLAREAIGQDHKDEAIAHWQRVVEMPGLESRHYAQAWYFLRIAGVQPPTEKAKQLLGVVIEVPMNGGLDLLAAYPERTARYYNYSGAGVVWEHPDDSMDDLIDALLREGQRVVDQIGPWEKSRPPAPPAGQMRLNFLTPSGLHFGQGSMDVLSQDPMAKPVIDAGVKLMQALITRDQKSRR
jgi:hypothetical protein